MFQWNITLSDRQVIMLAAFLTAEEDQYGSQFHAVNSLIGDAWDIRAMRKLTEWGLISVNEVLMPTGMKTNLWHITQKGEFIALAIMEDAAALKQIQLQNKTEARSVINTDGNARRKARLQRQYRESRPKP